MISRNDLNLIKSIINSENNNTNTHLLKNLAFKLIQYFKIVFITLNWKQLVLKNKINLKKIIKIVIFLLIWYLILIYPSSAVSNLINTIKISFKSINEFNYLLNNNPLNDNSLITNNSVSKFILFSLFKFISFPAYDKYSPNNFYLKTPLI